MTRLPFFNLLIQRNKLFVQFLNCFLGFICIIVPQIVSGLFQVKLANKDAPFSPL